MNDLCLLAASLMAQGHVPGWQLAVPLSALPDYLPNAIDTTVARLCPLEVSSMKAVGAKPPVSMAEIDRPEFSSATLPRLSSKPILQPVSAQKSEWQKVEERKQVTPDDLAHSSATRTPDVATLLPTVRPVTGGQLYQQRWAALRAGKTYTHLPPDSFSEDWNNATEQPTYQQWVELLQAEAAAMANGQGASHLSVLVGDSLTLWYPPELMTGDRFWLNQGISGDTTAGVRRRLNTFKETEPDTIYVMAGINDLQRGATDMEVVANLRQIMRQLKQDHPQARIIVHSILPTRLASLPVERIRRLNSTIATAAQEEGVFFLNLQMDFADEWGILRRELTTDGIHLTQQGYQAWGSVIASIL